MTGRRVAGTILLAAGSLRKKSGGWACSLVSLVSGPIGLYSQSVQRLQQFRLDISIFDISLPHSIADPEPQQKTRAGGSAPPTTLAPFPPLSPSSDTPLLSPLSVSLSDSADRQPKEGNARARCRLACYLLQPGRDPKARQHRIMYEVTWYWFRRIKNI